MKKIIFAFAATIITLCTSAQADSLINFLPPDSFIKTIPPDFDSTPKNINSNPNDKIQNSPFKKEPGDKLTHPDGVLMLNGKMMHINGGAMTTLRKNIIMNNGTTVKRDGSILKINGTKIWMKEGDHMDFFGKILTLENTDTSGKQQTH